MINVRSSLARPLAVPPFAMRELVGPTDLDAWTPQRGQRVFPNLKERRSYDMVLDFGCGCGRIARKLALSKPKPKRYIGVDLHAGMIDWCNQHLAPSLPAFTFIHQDVHNPGFNPDPTLPRTAAFPVGDQSVSLLIAISVFTHLTQAQTEFYLDEVARVLRPDGIVLGSFFLFEKRYFPMMQDFQNALYINPDDPTNAVILDRDWFLAQLRSRGLSVRRAQPAILRGFHRNLEIVRGVSQGTIAPDDAPFGRMPPPVPAGPSHEIGA